MMTSRTEEAMRMRRTESLAETAWLGEHVDDPQVRIVDMRGFVKTTDLGGGKQEALYMGAQDDYIQGHIPGAIYLDWTEDIIDPGNPVPVQVASAERLAAVLGQAGIGDEHTVVAYDSHPASQFATRLWWVLRFYGHTNAKVLNGGLKKWLAEGRPLDTALPSYPRTTFTPHIQPAWRVEAEQVQGMLRQPGITLVDARDEGQYTGAIWRGSRAGRIPGALHLPREAICDPTTGTFRPSAELQQLVSQAGIEREQQVVAYCNGGVAATSVLFALHLLGYPHLANYDGSWNEWGERPELLVEKDEINSKR